MPEAVAKETAAAPAAKATVRKMTVTGKTEEEAANAGVAALKGAGCSIVLGTHDDAYNWCHTAANATAAA